MQFNSRYFIFPLILILFIVIVIQAPRVKADTQQYQQIDLGSLGGGNTIAYGINNSNHIVGQSDINGQVHHAFLWEDRQMIDLGTLGGSSSTAFGINNNDQIVGESQIASNAATHAFLWENGQMKDLGVSQEMKDFEASLPSTIQPALNSAAYGINDNGAVVGKGYMDFPVGIDRDNNAINYMHALYWKNDAIVDLHKDMVNIKTLFFTDTPLQSYATSINNADQIVGTMIFPQRPSGDSLYIDANPQEAFLWQNNVITDITNTATALIEPSDINNNGEITINNTTNTVHPNEGFIHGYIWPANNSANSCGVSGDADELISINNYGGIFGVKAYLGGPYLGQGYVICQNDTLTDFGTYPNENYTILDNTIIKGEINDYGDAVVYNIFYKNLQASPTPTISPSPSATPSPTETLTPTPTDTPTPTSTPTATRTSTDTPTPTLTPTIIPSITNTPTTSPTPIKFPKGLVHNKNLLTKLSGLFCRIGFDTFCGKP